MFTVNYGHGLDEIVDVAADQARKIAFTAPTMSTNPPALKLADLLTSLLPEQFTTVKFASGGFRGQRVRHQDGAAAITPQTGSPRKYKIISRYHSYHGSTGFAGAASGQPDWKSK